MTADTVPREFVALARERLYDNDDYSGYLDDLVGEGEPIPDEHIEAAAMEAYTACTETLDTFVETLIAGRPYDTPLVEWEHRELQPEHQDCIPWDDAKEVAQQ